MRFNDLSSEKIAEALSFLDYEDRAEWVEAAFSLRSELGESGFDIWIEWSKMSSSFNLGAAKSVWKSSSSRGGVTIASLIYKAQQQGFKLGEHQPISRHVQQQRAENRAAAEREAKIQEKEKIQRQLKKSELAKSMFEGLSLTFTHPYLERKDILSHGAKCGPWSYKDDEGNIINERNALIIPMYFEGEIVSLQAIMPNGEKKLMSGAKKSGTYYVIGDEPESEDDAIDVLLCEGFATGATLNEATQLLTYVAFDSGNLLKVAKYIRSKYKFARITVCADNDQYKRINTGIRSAQKVCCEVDAEMVYPIFSDISSKPTDFNDLYILSGYSPIIEAICDRPRRYFAEKKEGLLNLSAFDLEYIEDAKKVFNESESEIDIARAAYVIAMRSAGDVPAFKNVESIRCEIDHPKLSPETHMSIMCRVQWSIFSRKRVALSSIKPESWSRKHDYINVTDLSQVEINSPVTLISAPMGAGKTKKVIKPMSEKSRLFVAIAHRRSLISDLSRGLGVISYEDIKTREQADFCEKMAICLPSTQSMLFSRFMFEMPAVAIDEISQNIRFTSSKECRVVGAAQDQVFSGLQKIISDAEKVVACDASIDQTTLTFFEKSRPDERFTIIEQPPSDNGRQCLLYDELDEFLANIDSELQSGGKVWLSVESAEKAEVLSSIFGERFKCITITSRNSKTKAIKQFLDDIEDQSRNYDIVIASPAISSGVSVEHKSGSHFTMIAGMASGHSICFSDFAQMLGRVRYVKDYHIYLQKNNKRNEWVNAQSIITGLRQAASMEGGDFRETTYSHFKSHIDATEEIYKSDFANGLVWFLEYFCFKLKKGMASGGDYSLSEKMKELSAEAKEKYRNDIINAEKIDKGRADKLNQMQSLSDEQHFQLIAFKLRLSFNFDILHDITPLDIDMFESLASVDRFAAFKGLSYDRNDIDQNISLRRFEKARIKACEIMFDGFNMEKITPEDCDKMIKIVASNQNRFLLSAIKLVPSAYGQWKEDKTGKLKEYPIPSKTSKSVAAILDKFGLGWSRSSSRVNGKVENHYKVNAADLEKMEFYASSRYRKKDELPMSSSEKSKMEIAEIKRRIGK